MKTLTPYPPIIDGHTDVLLDLADEQRQLGRDFFIRSDVAHVDLPRLGEGGIGAALFACFLPEEWLAPDESWRRLLTMVDLLKQIVTTSNGKVEQVCSVAQLEHCLKSGTFGAILHWEGADPIDADLVLLRIGYELGLRSLGLTWSRPNIFAQGVGPDDSGEGLTDLGKKLVDTCNRFGILVDVSHLNDAGFWDVIEVSSKPIVASHSNCRAISPHPRNLTDDQICAVAENGGLIGLNFCVGFLRPDMDKNTDVPIDLMVDHIDRMVDIAGIDHVAIGSDFDGTIVPDVIRDAAGTGKLIDGLRSRGFDDAAVSKICQGNWFRVIREVWVDESTRSTDSRFATQLPDQTNGRRQGQR
jgi:membrane dipeptidase